MMSSKKAMLMILDGWGLGAVPSADAILAAHTPVMDKLRNNFPNATLLTCGTHVGLPEGQMGNSEVGHLNLGAGRIVYQELQRVNVAIETEELRHNPTLLAAFHQAKTSGKRLHFIGLVSDGGVHSHLNHIKALCTYAYDYGIEQHYVHAFTDGRDTNPKSGCGFLSELQQHIAPIGGRIATVVGRYYAMDRDQRWERVKKAYDALTKGIGAEYTTNILSTIQHNYANNKTDEFFEPIIHTKSNGEPVAIIQPGDVVLCFNFRTDRCREITQALTQNNMEAHGMHTLPLYYVTLTEYDKSFKGVEVIFRNDNLQQTLGEVLASHGKKQLRIAETEKYPHVTFFFSGGREATFEGERRILIPSPKTVATYDQKPEMSAHEITEAVLPVIEEEAVDFICLNFANTDMVGHTGVWEAAITAAQTVDECVGKIFEKALPHGYALFIIADHGNSDYMINEDGSPNTAHTLNPVPIIFVAPNNKQQITDGKLADVAPTILSYMGIAIPNKMTGTVLLKEHP